MLVFFAHGDLIEVRSVREEFMDLIFEIPALYEDNYARDTHKLIMNLFHFIAQLKIYLLSLLLKVKPPKGWKR